MKAESTRRGFKEGKSLSSNFVNINVNTSLQKFEKF